MQIIFASGCFTRVYILKTCMGLKTRQINVRMDDSLAEELKGYADKNLTTPSQVIRKAIHDFLQKWKRNGKG